MQCTCSILPSVACPALRYFSTLSHKRYDFREKVFGNKSVICFPLQLLSETFLILRRTERGMLKNVYCSSCTVLLFVCLHVQYCYLSVFMYSTVICLSSCTILLFVCPHVQYSYLSVFMYNTVICLSSCTVLLYVCLRF